MLDPSQEDAIADSRRWAGQTGAAIPQFVDAPAFHDEVLTFRGYTLFPASRILLRGDDSVCIGGRAFDLLVILLRHRGMVTPKNTITDYVWPSTYLEESNLRFQVAVLRRVLGPDADLIKTVPGRGYLLAAEATSKTVPAAIKGRGIATSAVRSGPVRPGSTAAGQTPAELLEDLLHSVGLLVASYGSLEGFLGALKSHHLPPVTRFLSPPSDRASQPESLPVA